MADLLLVHFFLIPGPVRKEKQFCLADDFSGLDFTIPSRTSHSAFGFPALFRVFTPRTDRCSGIRKMFYTTRTEQEISTFPLSDVFILRLVIPKFNRGITANLGGGYFNRLSNRFRTSGHVQHRKSAIHGVPVTLRMLRVKSDTISFPEPACLLVSTFLVRRRVSHTAVKRAQFQPKLSLNKVLNFRKFSPSSPKLRWPNTVFARALADAIQRAH